MLLAETISPPLVGDYHIDIGIPEAARIKALEDALFENRISGGNEGLLGMFPHLGGLLISLSRGSTSVCGSSLISPTRAVTAAHCWLSPKAQAIQLTVVLGSTTLFYGGTRVNTSNVVTHPNYMSSKLHNDVAVISFNNISLNKNIQPIALAEGNDLFVGVWATAAGFGRRGDSAAGSISKSQSLHYVDLQVITNSVCWSTYTSSVIDSTLCVATTGGKSTCPGDSGGPLETNVTGVRTLIGIVSFGQADGCENNYPTGFARVTIFRSWLLSI